MTFTQACSQPGIVSALTKVVDPKVSGNRTRKPRPCTAPDSRTSMPMKMKTQHRHSAKPSTSRQAAKACNGSVPTRKPSAMPNANVTTIAME